MIAGAFAALLAVAVAAPTGAQDASSGHVEPVERAFTFVYEVEVQADRGPVDVWVPLPAEGPHQRLVDERIEASIPGETVTEQAYGNRVWHGRIDDPGEGPISVRLEADVVREAIPGPFTAQPPDEVARARFLGPNARVPVSGALIDEIRADLPETEGDREALRAIFDFVLEHMEYKKVGEGWGQGSTAWACSEKYGNCTDFHALVTSLARAEGLPTRFHIGFPIPVDRTEAAIPGYHCWVDVWVEGAGWVPVDASEAWKHREQKERFFAALPADRVQFTTGRDLDVGQQGEPLNYLIYPYVEVDGQPHDAVESRFSFRARDDGS